MRLPRKFTPINTKLALIVLSVSALFVVTIYITGHNLIDISCAVLIYIIAIWLLISVFVGSKISALNKDIDKISGAKLYARRVTVTGNDELTNLAENINKMLNEFQSSHESIIKEKQAQKATDEIKDNFIGFVSHELRNPLAIVSGSLNLLDRNKNDLSVEEYDGLLRDAIDETDYMNQMVTNLIELARAQAGRLNLDIEPISIKTLISETMEQIRAIREGRQIIKDIPDDVPLLYADPLKLRIVLRNLIDNAIKYSPETSPIFITVRADRESLTLGVRDKGKGITLNEQNRLFKPFERLENSSATGIGLGLIACQKLIETHGGKMRLESQPGSGSTFYFSIPLNNKR
jgi:signal transduction histidine kinase